MSAPSENLPANEQAELPQTIPPTADATSIDPDDPAWNTPAALGFWLVSLLIMFAVNTFAVIGYMLYKGIPVTEENINNAVTKDPHAILSAISSTFLAHALTLTLGWLLVTGVGRRSFRRAAGLEWGGGFGFTRSLLLAAGLFVVALALAYLFGGEKTPFDEMIESSPQAQFVTIFLATLTAPLAEELVYRGVLYPALRRTLSVSTAIMIVTALFAGIHYFQYNNNLGVLAAITMLSFALTCVRALSGKLLPCIIIHAAFNGIQCVLLVYNYFFPLPPPVEVTPPVQTAATALLHTLLL